MPTGKLIPRALVTVTDASPLSASCIMDRLRQGSPSIEVRPDPAGFYIDPQGLQPGDVATICDRIRSIVGDGDGASSAHGRSARA
jgi:hypothetical protein